MKMDSLLLAQTPDNSTTGLHPSAKCSFMRSLACVHRISGLDSLNLTCATFQFQSCIFANSAFNGTQYANFPGSTFDNSVLNKEEESDIEQTIKKMHCLDQYCNLLR